MFQAPHAIWISLWAISRAIKLIPPPLNLCLMANTFMKNFKYDKNFRANDMHKKSALLSVHLD